MSELSVATFAVVLNGEVRELPSGTNVATLVADLAAGARMVAVEINGEIAPRQRWAETPLAAGDRIELVRFVQGG